MKKFFFVMLTGFIVFLSQVQASVTNRIENQSTVTITNAWNLGTDTLFIGEMTFGNSLIVEQGGSVTSGYGVIGYDPGAFSNSVVIRGTNSSWVSSGGVIVGELGSDNTFSVLDQASITLGGLELGKFSVITNNTFEVDNARGSGSYPNRIVG